MWPLLLNRGMLLDALLCVALLALSATIFDTSSLSTDSAALSPLAVSADLHLDPSIMDAILGWNTRLYLATPESARQWTFDRNSPAGPQHWPEMISTCDPTLFPQSPIDVNASSAVIDPSTSVELLYPVHSIRRPVSLSAHGLEFHASPSEGSESIVRGSRLGDDSSWRFDSGHVHLPSDHTVNGGSYPMELHLVHTQRGVDTSPAALQASASEGPFAVVAVLFKEGRHNPTLGPIIEAATRVHHARSSAPDRALRVSALIDLRQLVPTHAGWWHYMGSLTTPPCLSDHASSHTVAVAALRC